ncbi:MAG: hypothetical protein COU29_03375 [Candidatus Magasanikbacteria bacterium CG10_big_fil_rev_8_21_14_0_10_36_32]|uniref:Cell division protein FtsL n=1 Tax=Candidatus Magasanikbacteria bacterium CG10_big_fil_rev_8_21_14_0_10_36_32 TaxID=1974646 RepID=A0A2M6W675_9BACT|nr:MAG: hypothetical protein COU29_03375 [Candidatus Magasanikbacteria bacterium CG10_big_fil_rev_8_21_14_0_10_36_32]
MSLRRKIKYQFEYYHRFLLSVGSCLRPPAWLVGRGMRVICLFLLTVVSVAYIGAISRAAGSGYQMKSLQKRVDNLQMEIQKIDVDIAGQNSMSSLEKRLQETDMILVKNIKYIVISGSEMAKQ